MEIRVMETKFFWNMCIWKCLVSACHWTQKDWCNKCVFRCMLMEKAFSRTVKIFTPPYFLVIMWVPASYPISPPVIKVIQCKEFATTAMVVVRPLGLHWSYLHYFHYRFVQDLPLSSADYRSPLQLSRHYICLFSNLCCVSDAFFNFLKITL